MTNASHTVPALSSPRLDHLNLSVASFEETARWYGEVFGFEVAERGLYDGRPWGVLRAGDTMLCAYESPDKSPPGEEDDRRFLRIYHFALRLTDGSAWADHAYRLKLDLIYGGPIRYPHSTSWYIEDPSGYSIEVVVWDRNEVRFESVASDEKYPPSPYR